VRWRPAGQSRAVPSPIRSIICVPARAVDRRGRPSWALHAAASMQAVDATTHDAVEMPPNTRIANDVSSVDEVIIDNDNAGRSPTALHSWNPVTGVNDFGRCQWVRP